MGGDEDVELAGVVADTGGKARAGQHLVEGVSDVFQVAVEVVAVVREEVLQALEQVAVPGLIDVGVLAEVTS